MRTFLPSTRRRVLARAGLAACATLSSVGALAFAAPPAAAVGGSVSGTAFRDYSANGARDALEPGESGIIVTVYDSVGAVVGTATTGPAGAYTATVTGAATSAVRVEFAIPVGKQSYLRPAPLGTGSDGAVAFATIDDTGVDFGVHDPGEYCQANPTLVTACQGYGHQQGAVGAVAALRSFPYDASGARFNNTATATAATVATFAEVGSTFALERSRTRNAVYAASFQKQYSGFGPGGPGAVYQTVGGVTSTLATIPNAGTDVRAAYPVNATQGVTPGDGWLGDPTFDAVGKLALGDMALTDDEATLWVVNLNDRQLYPVSTATGTVGTPVAVPLATGAAVVCAATDVRPFALARHEGALYLGSTCSAQSTQVATDLRFYVHRFDPVARTFSAAPVFETGIGGTPHGQPGSGCNGGSGTWRPWPTTDRFQAGQCGYAQPWLVSLAFDRGNLILGVRDRFGDQSGADYPFGAGTIEGVIAGDLLRACGNAATGWTLESNGTCGGVTTAGAGNNQGPGGGEYYFEEHFASGTNHQETSNGGLLQIPGFGEVVHTVMDPDLLDGNDWRAGGVHFEDNATGANDHWFQLYDKCDTSGLQCASGRTETGMFGKANGLGDLVALCDAAPVEIGNRVWLDTDADGRQDADEPALAGVTVTLYAADGTTPLATVTSAVDGTYVFSSDPTRTDAVGRNYAVPALTPGAVVIVGAPPTTVAAPYGSVALTTPGTGGATIDSDVDATTGRSAPITVVGPGRNDHDHDIGYVPALRLGNLVWRDDDDDGARDGGEPGIAAVPVRLYAAGDLTVPIATTTTDVDGRYLFEGLRPGSYVVEIVAPTGSRSSRGAGNAFEPAPDEDATVADSDDNGTGAAGRLIRSAPVDLTAGAEPTSDADDSADPTVDANSNLQVDFGVVPLAGVGNYVWIDTNRDGLQNEPPGNGVNGVTVTLQTASGAPVSDADGNPVAPLVTAADPTTGAPGYYAFGNLPPGSYRVVFSNLPAGFVTTRTDAGPDDVDSDGLVTAPVTVAAGQVDLTLDLGLTAPVRVGDFTWLDTDGDGVQDAGEPGLPGVTVSLVDPGGNPVVDVDGNPVAPRVTDAQGRYLFDNLPAGTYVVRFAPPAGYAPTVPNAGADDGADSDGPEATSAPLPPGGADLTLDAGFVPLVATGSVVGEVFLDGNRNGRREPNEAPIGGVTVQLVDPAGRVVATVVTGPDGRYRFDGVAPGSYLVRQIQPAGYGSTTVNEVAVVVAAGAVPVDVAGFGEVPLTLPRTGASPWTGLAVASIVVGLGVLLVGAGSRRRLHR